MDGAGETVQLLADYESLMERWADPEADYEKLGASQADLEARIEAAQGWDLQRTIEIAMDALRLPPPAPVRGAPLGWRETPSGPVPTPAQPARPPAARRAHEPSRCRERALAREATGLVSRDGGGDHPRQVLPRQRRSMDTRTRSGERGSRSRATTPPGWSRSRLASTPSNVPRQPSNEPSHARLEWVRLAPKARQAKGRARLTAYETLRKEAEAYDPSQERVQIHIPPGPRLGDQVVEVDESRQGIRRQAPHREPLLPASQGRHRRCDRRQRRRKDHAVQDADRRRDRGRRTP